MQASFANENLGSAAQDMRRIERNARLLWLSGIVGLLSLQIVIGGAAIYLANSDDTVAIVPNYYQSAVNWDVTRRSLKLTEKLGWAADCSVGPVVEGQRNLTVVIQDKNGEPIPDLRIYAECFHHARASEQAKLILSQIAPGMYSAGVAIPQNGLWQVNLRLEGAHGIAAIKHELRVK